MGKRKKLFGSKRRKKGVTETRWNREAKDRGKE